MNSENWELWLERLYSLRRDKRGSHERPHKPVLLLSIVDLMDRGAITENRIPMTSDLVATFKRYFAVVRESDDKPTIENPFYFLSGDRFWHLTTRGSKEPLYKEGHASRSPTLRQLREAKATGHFDESLWELLRDRLTRHQLREALIARYFPEYREKLAAIQCLGASTIVTEDPLPPTPARSAAFRRTVLEIYDYRCAACGMRVILSHAESLVEAAHLIPFEISRNDKPTNGMALCPNHHWAMDRYLIAPCPHSTHRAGVWRVNRDRLDDRIEGQRDLITLNDRAVIAPSEEKFYPAIEALHWREKHLIDSRSAG